MGVTRWSPSRWRAHIGDLDSRPLLSWFPFEQIEEEATVSQIVGRLKFIDGDGPGLLRLEAELGARPVKTTEV